MIGIGMGIGQNGSEYSIMIIQRVQYRASLEKVK